MNYIKILQHFIEISITHASILPGTNVKMTDFPIYSF